MLASQRSVTHTARIGRELVDALCAAHGRADTPFGVYALAPDQPEAELAREVEQSVFAEHFGNTAAIMAAEYGPYDADSRFLLVVDHRARQAAGMLRIIVPGAGGLKSFDDLEREWGRSHAWLAEHHGVEPDASRWWDLATLAVAPDYRGPATSGLVALALYQSLNLLAHREGVEWAVAILDLVVLDLLNSAWISPFTPVPGAEPKRYLDSPASLPIYHDAATFKAKLALMDPAGYRLLYEGEGLEQMVSTPDPDVGLTDCSSLAS